MIMNMQQESFWDYKQEATESNRKEFADSTHIVVVSKNMNNATTL